MSMLNPPQPGRIVRQECLRGLTVMEAEKKTGSEAG